MDFYEQLIKQKKNGKDYLAIGLTIVAGLLFIVLACMIVPVFLPLWIFTSCWFGYFIISGKCLEYEYSISEHVMDIDRIAGKKRRRKMIVIDLKEIQGYGVPDDEGYRHAVRKGLQVLDFSSRREKNAKKYFVVPRPKGTYVVVFEPDETMLDYMEKYIR